MSITGLAGDTSWQVSSTLTILCLVLGPRRRMYSASGLCVGSVLHLVTLLFEAVMHRSAASLSLICVEAITLCISVLCSLEQLAWPDACLSLGSLHLTEAAPFVFLRSAAGLFSGVIISSLISGLHMILSTWSLEIDTGLDLDLLGTTGSQGLCSSIRFGRSVL